MTKILLIENSAEVRTTLHGLLSLESDFTILESSPNLSKYLEINSVEVPDIIVMDFVMPEQVGVEQISKITTIFPKAVVIILTMHDTLQIREMASEAGAFAFISKFEEVSNLLDAIKLAKNKIDTGDKPGSSESEI